MHEPEENIFGSMFSSRLYCNVTKEHFEREKNYRTSQAIVKSMLNQGLITDREYKKIDTILKHKYRPVFGGL